MALKPEDRIDAADLLREIEGMMPLKLAELNRMSPEFQATAVKICTDAADLGLIPRGNLDVEPRDAEFWNSLVDAYKWLDPDLPIVRPDLTEPSVTAEAFDFFLPGRRERRNRDAARDPVMNDLTFDPW
jgi:hypothetical protein